MNGLYVNHGNKVPADYRIIECQQLKLNKYVWTRCSELISCSVNSIDMNCKETRNLLFIASSIVEGSGTALVVETGNKTVVGKIYQWKSSARWFISSLTIEINIFMSISFLCCHYNCCYLVCLWILIKRLTSFLTVFGLNY